LIPHAYADDTQLYGFCRPADSAELYEEVSVCIDEVSAWMASNRLQLNHAKTEVLWCSSSRRQHQIPSGPVRIGSTDVQPVCSIHDNGVYIDADTLEHDHEDPRHSRRQSVLRGSTTDPERAAVSLTSCLADLGSCTDCQQDGLLQLGTRWPVAVRLECRRPFGFLSEAVRTHNPIAS